MQTTLGTRAKAALIVGGTATPLPGRGRGVSIPPSQNRGGPENALPGDSSHANARTNSSRPALARVNSELIAYDSIADECMQRDGQEVLESFINRTIIDQACRKRGHLLSLRPR